MFNRKGRDRASAMDFGHRPLMREAYDHPGYRRPDQAPVDVLRGRLSRQQAELRSVRVRIRRDGELLHRLRRSVWDLEEAIERLEGDPRDCRRQ